MPLFRGMTSMPFILFAKNEKNSFLEIEQPICNINDSNTFILIFVVSSTGNYYFGISIPNL